MLVIYEAKFEDECAGIPFPHFFSQTHLLTAASEVRPDQVGHLCGEVRWGAWLGTARCGTGRDEKRRSPPGVLLCLNQTAWRGKLSGFDARAGALGATTPDGLKIAQGNFFNDIVCSFKSHAQPSRVQLVFGKSSASKHCVGLTRQWGARVRMGISTCGSTLKSGELGGSGCTLLYGDFNARSVDQPSRFYMEISTHV